MSAYPEHDKLKALAGKNEIVGDFLEWLTLEQRLVIARWRDTDECSATGGPFIAGGVHKWNCVNGRMIAHELSNKPGTEGGQCSRCNGTGLIKKSTPILEPAGLIIEKLLAMYFEIDLEKIAAEKDQILRDFEKELNW